MRTAIILLAFPVSMLAQVLGPFGNNMHAGGVRDAIEFQNKLYLGGPLQVNNVNVGGTAVYDGASTSPFAGGSTIAFTIYNNQLYMAGIYNGNLLVKKWDGFTLTTATSPIPSSPGLHWLSDIEIYNGDIFLSGAFKINNSIYALAAYDGTNWNFFGQIGRNDAAYTLKQFSGKLMVGGLFDTINNTPCNGVAAFDGANWTFLNGGPQSAFATFNSVIQNQKWIVAGSDYPVLGAAIHEWDGSTWQQKTFQGLSDALISTAHIANGLLFFELVYSLDGTGGIDTKSRLFLETNNNLVQLSDTCWFYNAFIPQAINLFNGIINYQNEWIAYGSFSHISPGVNGIYCPSLASVNGILGEDESCASTPNLTLSPNPTADFLTLENTNKHLPYHIYNVHGRLEQTGMLATKIDVRNLPAGQYIIEVTDAGTQHRQQFLKVD